MHLFFKCIFRTQLGLVRNQTFIIISTLNRSATSAFSVSFQRPYFTTVKMFDSNKQSLVAVAQMTATSDKAENFAITKKQIQEASSLGAKVIFLPEACDYIAESHAQSLELAESIDGPLIKSYCELAVQNHIWISIGGFHNKCSLGGKMHNTHLVIDSNGKITGRYDKTHLFDVEIPEKKIKLKESDYIEKGGSVASLVESPVGKIGLGICYDVRFPEFSLSLAHMGADIITYPSAFTVATGLAHWETLLRARAIETQCYVVAAAQTGIHNSKRSSYGHAMVIDPWGTVIAQCREGTSLALAMVDLEYLNKVRREMPVFNHRRHEIYHKPTCVSPSLPLPEDDAVFVFGQVTIRGWAVFYQSRHSVAFVNRKCVVPGHVLVIPLKPFRRIPDMQADELADLFLTSQRVQRGMELFHGVSSSNVDIQDGPDAGQSIQHVHVHILPRRPNDFKENDQVYDELKNHDKGPIVDWREEDDMRKEAAELRDFFKALM
ncbi:hypothetical protein GHT06_019966 [Daphnia sinensis]|uniref:Nitrilase and fragile histidine triad fusion protein NitFhit n=1 Tax=Daphnia sinensis TaxID=1820382 RepID=A0AAD5L3Q4_9CRUS|nr:hypothetical protein GHT06_019966 [Daphnia sinensis]